MTPPLRVANCSGFLGDRDLAMREMLDGGPVDVLTGDYLAELTMLILARQQLADPAAGYAGSFLAQLEGCLADALDRGVRIVANAGGLNPKGLATAVGELAERLGRTVRIAVVDGDDVRHRIGELSGDERPVVAANAYLGCFGIARALQGGAEIVVTGRVTDASLVVGAAAAHHHWGPGDLDALAGGTVAGHILECGAQATGGNFSLFTDLLDGAGGESDRLDHVGFPLAEIADDGTSVIAKHPDTGGAVTVATVTEQLLYECTGVRYGGPDVVTRFDTIRLAGAGPDRVAVTGTRGEPPTGWLKVGVNRLGGYRNAVTIPLTGLDIELKAALLRRQLGPALARIAEAKVVLARTDRPDAGTEEEAAGLLHVIVKDPDAAAVDRAFTAPLIELALASVPGFFPTAPPGRATPYGVFETCWLPAAEVPHRVTLPDGAVETLPAASPAVGRPPSGPPTATADSGTAAPPPATGPPDPGATSRVPLGTVAGARSGDKGGTATLGVYSRRPEGYPWLAGQLTAQRLVQLLPEAEGLTVRREELPNLRAVLFQIEGLLGDGVAAGTRFDPQAKALGEWLRSRLVDVPTRLLEGPP
jgi:hypothetical protein